MIGRFFILLIIVSTLKLFGIISTERPNGNRYLKSTDFHNFKYRNKREIISNNPLRPPEIVVDLEISVHTIKERYIMECKAKGNPEPTIKWFVGNNIKNNFSEVASEVNSKGGIEIQYREPSKPDIYYCSATNNLGSVISRKSIVQRVFVSKDAKIQYDSLEVFANEKAVIVCYIMPTLFEMDFILKHWEISYRDKGPKWEQIDKTGGRYSVINDTKVYQLHIRNVTKYDFNNMNARCILSNRFVANYNIDGSMSASPKEFPSGGYNSNQINIYDKCQGKEIRVKKGETIELPWCSKPTTEKITWYRSENSTMLKSEPVDLRSPKYEMVSQAFENLIIHNIDITEEGYYFAKSPNVRDYVPFNIRVMEPIGIEISPTFIQTRYKGTLLITCLVSGYPVTSVNWYHNTQLIGPGNLTEISKTMRMTTFKTTGVTLKSAGVYQCIAENSRDSTEHRLIDNAQASVSVVIIEMAPELVSQSPQVAKGATYATTKLQTDSSVISIKCVFNSIPQANITWYRDDQPIPIVDNLWPQQAHPDPFTVETALTINLGQLPSIGDKWRYGGEYRAVASNKHGQAECKTLVFVNGVLIIREEKNPIFLHGQKMSLKCYVISDSRPEILWHKVKQNDLIRIPESHTEMLSADNREFIIEKIDKDINEGTYRCQANLGKVKVSTTFNVTIAKPPVEVTLPDQINLTKLSQSVVHLCIPRGKPDKPWYAWWEFHQYKSPINKSIILEVGSRGQSNVDGIKTEYQQSESNEFPATSLPAGVPSFLNYKANREVQIWMDVKDEFHLSNITCVVQNHAGVIRHPIVITIVKIEFENAPPTEINVVLGDSFMLNCSAKGNLIPTTTTWSYDKSIQPPNFLNVTTSKKMSIHQLSNGSLVVNNISLEDPIRFMCIIKANMNPDKMSKVVSINVKVPATIIRQSSTIDLELNTKKNVTCVVRADKDLLNVTWQKYESQSWNDIVGITQEERPGKLTLFSIGFDRVQDDNKGDYKCIAKNKYNKEPDVMDVKINVVDVPGPVNIIKGKIKLRETSIEIAWERPVNDGKKPIKAYLVSYSNASMVWNVTTRDTKITLEPLRPYQLYEVVIKAINDVGVGMEHRVALKTLSAVPEGPVLGLSAVPNSSTNFKLTWSPPDASLINGQIKNYQVCYLKNVAGRTLDKQDWPNFNDANKQDTITNCKTAKKTEIEINELLKFTEYAFRVIVQNDAGFGPASYIKGRTIEDYPENAPTHVQCTPNDKSLDLAWNPPPPETINGILEGYKISYFRPDRLEDPDHSVNLSETTHRLDGLLPNTLYSIAVRVFNKKGLGPPSAFLSCTTNEAAPNAPSFIKAFAINDSCALVSWTPPTMPNGKLTMYCIKFNKHNRSDKCIDAKLGVPYLTDIICYGPYAKDDVVSVIAKTSKKGPAAQATVSDFGGSKIISFPRNITASRGSKLILDCETLPSNTPPTWDNCLSENHCTQLTNGSVDISKLSESGHGLYKCTADNDFIVYNVSIKPDLHGVPKQPKIDYYNVSNNSIFISWQSEGSSREFDPINFFFVKVSNLEEKFSSEEKVPGASRSYKVGELVCASNYSLDILAGNPFGNSSVATINFKTTGTLPTIPDTNRTIFSRHPTSICFDLETFLPGQGCLADTFLVTMKQTISKSVDLPRDAKLTKAINRSDISGKCINFTGLHPNTDYNYVIKATNRGGSVTAMGYTKTAPYIPVSTPTMKFDHGTSFFSRYKYWWVVVAVAALVLLGICSCTILHLKRRNYSERIRTNHRINNPTRSQHNTGIPPTPASMHRHRRLPTPPENNYDKGNTISVKPEEEEEDDMLKPYATYESFTKPDPMLNNRPNRNNAPYNMGSQAHSYQYPDMMENSPHLMPVDPTTSQKLMAYENDLKQPLLNTLKPQGGQYHKGYSIGQEPRSRPQILLSDRETISRQGRGLPMVSESEAYRPSSSLCSSTTVSSTKEELSLFLRNGVGVPFSSRLQEQDEDGASTARAVNRSTLTNRLPRLINNTLSDDSTQPESYFESGSSGDDCGIRNFTADPPEQQRVIAPTSIRQIHHMRSHHPSTYDTVDRPSMLPVSSHFTFQQPRYPLESRDGQHFTDNNLPFRNPVPEEDEEEDSNNYTNNFVLV